jgi:hypothetical protein
LEVMVPQPHTSADLQVAAEAGVEPLKNYRRRQTTY